MKYLKKQIEEYIKRTLYGKTKKRIYKKQEERRGPVVVTEPLALYILLMKIISLIMYVFSSSVGSMLNNVLTKTFFLFLKS